MRAIMLRMTENAQLGMHEQDLGALPEPVRKRIPVYAENARPRALEAGKRVRGNAHLMNTLVRLAQAQNIASIERVKRLRRLADAYAAAVAPSAACTSGCSHCCHIGVTMFGPEAQLIAKETGRQLSPASDQISDGSWARTDFGYHMPCPFLVDNKCSIYASRPLACRLQFNMDIDSLLCELVPGAAIPAPYFDHRQIDILIASSFVRHPVADIRDWFEA